MKSSTSTRPRRQTQRVAGKPRVPKGPNEPHDLNVTGLTESEVATLTLVAKHRTAKAVLTKGGVTTRNALIVWALRALIAVEGAEAHAWWDAIEAAKPAPKKRAKKGGAQ